MKTSHTQDFVTFLTGDLEWFTLDFLNVYEPEQDMSNLPSEVLEHNIDEHLASSDYPTSKITEYIANPIFHIGLFIILGTFFTSLAAIIHKIKP